MAVVSLMALAAGPTTANATTTVSYFPAGSTPPAGVESLGLLVQGEPALQDHQTGVAGWLDHSRRAANQQRWKQRVPPREYDELRDEAVVRSLLLPPLPADQ